MKALAYAVAVAGVAVATGTLSGCATIVEGSDQSISIFTTPDNADCVIKRGGANLTTVTDTPGTVVISKSADPLDITCKADGFMETTEIVNASGTGWSAGNILFGILGGGIGLVVDSASGAVNQYPETLQIALVPERFATAAERDRFFDERIADLDKKFSSAKQEMQSRCDSGNRPGELCREDLKEIQAEWDRRKEIAEKQRATALVGSAS